MKKKRVFKTIFLLIAILLMILPALVTFNEALTRIVETFVLYSWLQRNIVPIQVTLVTLILSPFKLPITPHYEGFTVNGTYIGMTWNCLGWQSLLLLTITLLVGFSNGHYTRVSKLETLAIGLLGTFLVNVLRLSAIVWLFTFSRPLYAIVYHDYLAAIVTTAWLFLFWWFVQRYVLEEKETLLRKLDSKSPTLAP